jgi:mannose/cellobiose epimerase-like protein (N-acyl-D-glucosamine 2-epimerase family)
MPYPLGDIKPNKNNPLKRHEQQNASTSARNRSRVRTSLHSHPRSVLQNHLHHIHVVQLPRAGVHRLQQLIHLIITHLLAQIRQDVAELSDSDEACEVLVEDLEAAAVLLRFAGVAEAAWAVENAGEVVKVDCAIIRVS